jgi:hypothetical protein
MLRVAKFSRTLYFRVFAGAAKLALRAIKIAVFIARGHFIGRMLEML